jgi:hypothetical protein
MTRPPLPRAGRPERERCPAAGATQPLTVGTASRVLPGALDRPCAIPARLQGASATGWHDVRIISQRLGHSSVAVTLDTYSHVRPAADEKVAHARERA